jgi:hypothetical protein
MQRVVLPALAAASQHGWCGGQLELGACWVPGVSLHVDSSLLHTSARLVACAPPLGMPCTQHAVQGSPPDPAQVEAVDGLCDEALHCLIRCCSQPVKHLVELLGELLRTFLRA